MFQIPIAFGGKKDGCKLHCNPLHARAKGGRGVLAARQSRGCWKRQHVSQAPSRKPAKPCANLHPPGVRNSPLLDMETHRGSARPSEGIPLPFLALPSAHFRDFPVLLPPGSMYSFPSEGIPVRSIGVLLVVSYPPAPCTWCA